MRCIQCKKESQSNYEWLDPLRPPTTGTGLNATEISKVAFSKPQRNSNGTCPGKVKGVGTRVGSDTVSGIIISATKSTQNTICCVGRDSDDD